MKWQHLCVNGKTMILEKRGVLENSGCGNDYFKNRLWTPRVLVSCKNLSIGTLSGVGTHAPVSTQKVEKRGVVLHAGAVCLLSVCVCPLSCFGGSFVHTQIGTKLMSCDFSWIWTTRRNQINRTSKFGVKFLCELNNDVMWFASCFICSRPFFRWNVILFFAYKSHALDAFCGVGRLELWMAACNHLQRYENIQIWNVRGGIVLQLNISYI